MNQTSPSHFRAQKQAYRQTHLTAINRDLDMPIAMPNSCFAYAATSNSAMDSSLEVVLNPKPGFCIKSAALEPGVYNGKIPVPANLKVFVNVAYDNDAPPPAPGALESAQAAMQSQGPPPSDEDAAPFLPVLVSEGRSVTDKGA